MTKYHVTMSENTAIKWAALERAKNYLLDYRPAGTVLSHAERLALAELISRDVSPADAAETVQATL